MTPIRTSVFAAGLLTAFGTGALIDSRPAQAAEYPWCMVNGDREGGMIENCGFISFAQCLQSLSGMSGLCRQNLNYRPAPPPPVRRAPRQKARPQR